MLLHEKKSLFVHRPSCVNILVPSSFSKDIVDFIRCAALQIMDFATEGSSSSDLDFLLLSSKLEILCVFQLFLVQNSCAKHSPLKFRESLWSICYNVS